MNDDSYKLVLELLDVVNLKHLLENFKSKKTSHNYE